MIYSIIIPVYNAQKYLRRCLSSILSHYLKAGEILIIDDNSTDRSWEIICEYVQKYPHFIKGIKTLQNGGSSVARNLGLELARGKYIIFMDSDDYWVNDKILELLRYASDESLVIGGFEVSYYGKQLMIHENAQYEEIGKKIFLERLIQQNGQFYYGVLWNKIFSAKIIKQYHILFREDIDLCEEWPFILEYIQYVKKISIVPSYFYSYAQDNDNSLIKKKRDRGENWRIMFSIYENICTVYKEAGIYETLITEISTFLLNPIIKELIEQVDRKASSDQVRKFLIQPIVQNAVSQSQARDVFEKLVMVLIKRKYAKMLKLVLSIKLLYSLPYKEQIYYKVIDNK